jgi:predicted Asp-tRNA(Asn)/Glu-tRNA(Gln) amidotransferase subunit C
MANVDKAKVEKEAREILDKFASALEKVEKEKGIEAESYVDREEFEREEDDGTCCDSGFKKRIFENAPKHDEDFIIGEKGSWK